MTSLATLAHAVTPAAPPFNANFFIVAATVIPVLFLALAVQGRTYESLVKAFSDAHQRWITPGPRIRVLAAGAISVIAVLAAWVILLYSAVAEVIAIYVLYKQQARSTTAHTAFAAVTFMVIMTAAGPALALIRVVLTEFVSDMKWTFSRHDTGAPEGHDKAQEAITGSAEPSGIPETGKTGTEAGN